VHFIYRNDDDLICINARQLANNKNTAAKLDKIWNTVSLTKIDHDCQHTQLNTVIFTS